MLACASTAALAAIMAMLVPQAAAEQTTMQVWIPMVPSDSPDFYNEVEGVVETVSNGLTVLGVRYKASAAPTDYYPTETITVGRSTFRYSVSEDTKNYISASIVDCTMTGCPTATTATCVIIESESGEGLSTATQTLNGTDISFGPLSLATPLPDSTTPECGAENADKTKTPSNTGTGTGAGATGTGGAGSDSAGSKVVGSWGAIAAVVALAFTVTI